VSDKKIHILKEAEKVIAAKGYDAASVRDIAEAAGVNLAMISYYFGSKEKLMEALLRYRMEFMALKMEHLKKDSSISPAEKIQALMQAYIERIFNNQDFAKIIMAEQVIRKHPATLALLRQLKLNNYKSLNDIVEEGIKKNFFKKDTEAFFLFTTLTGVVNHIIINKQFYIDFHQLENVNEEKINEMLAQKTFIHIHKIFKLFLEK